MNVDDTLLLAYVDGELSADRRAEVEAAATHSAEVAERLAALRASALPYAAAFDKQALPPVPPELSKRIAELASVSASTSIPWRHRRAPRLRLAAAFVAGAIISAAMLKLVSERTPDVTMIATTDSSWVKAIADYQTLYTRETVANVTEDRAVTEKILGDLRQNDGMPVVIPDLRSVGLTFKRVQRLSFHNQAVVQIVYLPEHGDPVALCMTQDARQDEVPQSREVSDLQTVAWRRGHLDYLLLARGLQLDLNEIGRRIAQGQVANLYGRVEYGGASDSSPA
jgi:anti-sigma factor RsiW